MQVEIAGGLHRRHPALPHQLHRLELKLPAKSSSLHRTPQFQKTPYLGATRPGAAHRVADVQAIIKDFYRVQIWAEHSMAA